MTHIAQRQLVYVPNEGHFVFKIWCRKSACYIHLALSADHVCRALGITHPCISWAMSSAIMANMLMSYMDICRYYPFIFSIMINGSDVYEDLRCYMKSFELPKNVNARVIQVLYHWHKNRGVGAGASDFYIVDYDLNELRCRREDYILCRE